jgi:hypothetical protein
MAQTTKLLNDEGLPEDTYKETPRKLSKSHDSSWFLAEMESSTLL